MLELAGGPDSVFGLCNAMITKRHCVYVLTMAILFRRTLSCAHAYREAYDRPQ